MLGCSAFLPLCDLLPGGVNSPARSFPGLGMEPIVVESAQCAELIDITGNRFIDYCGSWGATILGHSPPEVVSAVQDQLRRGTSFGFTSRLEGEVARRVIAHFPSIQLIRFVSSGTEATMTAIRLARAFTNREWIVKFNGNYHGHSDAFLIQAGSGVARLGPAASSQGVPPGVVATTCSLPYNDVEAVEALFGQIGAQIAAVIVEPIAGNMGVVPGTEAFLRALRRLTEQHGALLIFDEVITGFRVGLGGAQKEYSIVPDLTCLGKIIGGGFPVAAFGGRREIMEQLAPLGPVYQAGTLSGNAIAMTAALATLEAIQEEGFYAQLELKMERLCAPIERCIAANGLDACIQRVGSMWTLFLGRQSVRNMEESKQTDFGAFRDLFRHLYDKGILIPPSPFEASFIGRSHQEAQLDYTAATISESLLKIPSISRR